ncbi:MAG: NUDIX domain-containing protein [Firmicutes bacterium]|nr:NUDIX domain-containing protein [Bacillota bacterium]
MVRFHYLARAVITHGDLVLLARQIGASHTFLPGGHIEFGEPAKTALAREIFEETGLSVEVGDFLGAVEAVWEQGGHLNAEVNLIFMTFIPDLDVDTAVGSREGHLEFLWVPRKDVDSYNLLPVSMRKLVKREAHNTSAFWGSDI